MGRDRRRGGGEPWAWPGVLPWSWAWAWALGVERSSWWDLVMLAFHEGVVLARRGTLGTAWMMDSEGSCESSLQNSCVRFEWSEDDGWKGDGKGR